MDSTVSAGWTSSDIKDVKDIILLPGAIEVPGVSQHQPVFQLTGLGIPFSVAVTDLPFLFLINFCFSVSDYFASWSIATADT